MRVFFIVLILLVEVLHAVDLDLSENLNSKGNSEPKKHYFGERLFQGHFKNGGELRYNPDYLINVGDVITVKLWGAYEYMGKLKVDSKGNIFIPKVGNIYLLGVKNEKIRDIVAQKVKEVFNNSVSLYTNLESYQPISIFVTGNVNKPGIYHGASNNSVVQLLDKAGGIINGVGSYRDIAIIRNNQVVKTIDLYRFLLDGTLSVFQFHNGDVIKVGNIQNSISIDGEVARPYIFELLYKKTSIANIMGFILPKPIVTHFIVTHWEGGIKKVEKYPIAQASDIYISNGDRIEFISDHLRDNLSITIEGEHGGLHGLMVKKGETLKTLLSKIVLTPLSDISSVQLYRKSIAKKQKQLIDANLKDLESRVMTTGSATAEEAKIRAEEAKMILNFVKRASKVQPKGQVIINKETDLANIILEDGDKVFIPKKSQVVVIEGEVSLPNAQTYVEGYTIDDYIKSCGGFSPRANKEKILLVKKNGRVITYNAISWWEKVPLKIEAGDSILVLGKVDSKNIQITSSLTQIIYQIAVSAAVVLRAF